MYDVIIRCESGTHRLVDSTETGAYWEKVLHNVRWTSEETPEAAEAEVQRLTSHFNPMVRNVWSQPAGMRY